MRDSSTLLKNNFTLIIKVILFFSAIAILVLIFPKERKFKYEYQNGKPWMHEDLIAPFDFAILKSTQDYEKEKQSVLNNADLYFKFDQAGYEKGRNNLKLSFERTWKNAFADHSKESQYFALCLSVYDSIMKRGIIEPAEEITDKPDDFRIILVQGDNVAVERTLGSFFSIETADSYIFRRVQHIPEPGKQFLVQLLETSIFQNIRIDRKKTEADREKRLDEISGVRGMVQSGEIIISEGEIITPGKFMKIESLRREYETSAVSGNILRGIIAGQFILLSVTLIALYFFLFYFKREIFNENKKVFLILLVILMMVIATRIVITFEIKWMYLVPVCLVPIIIRVFFDTRTALFVHIITIIITGFLVPNSFGFIFLQLFPGIVTILSIASLEKRSQFFFTSLLNFISYSVIYSGLTLIQEGSLDSIDRSYFAMFAGNAMMLLFSYPIIYIFEKLFGIVTSVSLMELSDTNNKLLRRMSMNAPGTFQHSIQVANIAQELIFEIGGNALLVRAGAMYHDIGKLENPSYFIENQTSGINPHSDLTLEESASVILNHVSRGIEIAKKSGLPEQIIDFIRTHHGTRRTEYFYNLQKKAFPGEEISAEAFTYRGPVPFSKETAILMIADTVEAATRSLKTPDETRLIAFVDELIDNLLLQKQLVNADVTLKDIQKIRKKLKTMLQNIHHPRIEYSV